jgi:hypothetical protein
MVETTQLSSAVDAGGAGIVAWEDDRASAVPEPAPPQNTPVARAVPELGHAPMPVGIVGDGPAPGAYDPGTAEFRYWALADALTRGAAFWSSVLPAGTTWQADNGDTLRAVPDEGPDFNAYYDRNGLHFFHGDVQGVRVFSGESPDVVCHELGHAVLDAIKPQLWDVAAIETAAFHESFGDMSAMLSNLQLPSLRDAVLTETAGNLASASRLARLAEELGWAIRQLSPDAVARDCLRHAVHSFYYVDPSTLPPMAPAGQLSSEPHSFSRLFTGAFLRVLAGMFVLQPQQDSAALAQASVDAARLLAEGVRRAPVTPAFFSQVAAHMVAADQDLFSRRYRRALLAGFVRHGILAVRSAASVGTDAGLHSARAAAAASIELTDTELASVALDGGAYALPRDLMVRSPSQPQVFRVAGGLADVGASRPPAADQAASSFVEDLFRRGRVDVRDLDAESAPLISPIGLKTHAVRPSDGVLVLERLTFDCGFAD